MRVLRGGYRVWMSWFAVLRSRYLCAMGVYFLYTNENQCRPRQESSAPPCSHLYIRYLFASSVSHVVQRWLLRPSPSFVSISDHSNIIQSPITYLATASVSTVEKNYWHVLVVLGTTLFKQQGRKQERGRLKEEHLFSSVPAE